MNGKLVNGKPVAAKFMRHETGDRWACPCCAHILANVLEPPNAAKFGGSACLQLPPGFVWVKAREAWLRPKNRLAPDAGREKGLHGKILKADRGDARRQDFADYLAFKKKQQQLVRADLLPMNVVCPNTRCEALVHISAVRSLLR